MNLTPSDTPPTNDCTAGCIGHALAGGDWKRVSVVGDGMTASVGVYEVAVAGIGGTAGPSGKHLHGIVAVASTYGHAISGDGGVAVSSGGGDSTVGMWGYAYAKVGKAEAGACSVAGTTGGRARAAAHGIGVGWFSSTQAARVEAGAEGVAIGGTGCFVKVGKGGVLIAMAAPRALPAKTPATKVGRAGDGEIKADQWYQIEEYQSGASAPPAFRFVPVPAPSL